MGYRHMEIHSLRSIIRRYLDEQSIQEISIQEGFDRKTIRRYLTAVGEYGIEQGKELPDEKRLQEILERVLPANHRSRSKRDQLQGHKKELIALITGKRDDDEPAYPVKPKTAYRILRDKYGLDVSYETFKLYVREVKPHLTGQPAPLPIEVPPGSETQLDYCSLGLFPDPKTGKRRKTYAFLGKLSNSRYPFIEFCHTQDKRQFVASNVRMVEFFEGATQRVVIDNLKAGVLKPDLYDPVLNPAYRDFAEHYGTFIDTARVATPTDKAKVERLVQDARELFRYLVAVYPSYTLAQLNTEALKWCRYEYGMRAHGTTGEKPAEVWKTEELPAMAPLPPTRFEVPDYKWATVHQDRFFSYDKRRYAMPAAYRGEKVLLRCSGAVLRVFDSRYRLIREYVMGGQKINWLPGDFPEDREALLQGSYPQYLIRRARALGPAAETLITHILTPHAWTRARAARGMLTLLENYSYLPLFNDVCAEAVRKNIFVPKQLKVLFEDSEKQYTFEFIPPQSERGNRMTRSVMEYLN